MRAGQPRVLRGDWGKEEGASLGKKKKWRESLGLSSWLEGLALSWSWHHHVVHIKLCGYT